MKNYKRADRRHKKHVKFIKRVNKWFSGYSNPVRQEYKEAAMKGKRFQFLKTTGRPCNCSGCTYLKYKRPGKYKMIQNELMHL